MLLLQGRQLEANRDSSLCAVLTSGSPQVFRSSKQNAFANLQRDQHYEPVVMVKGNWCPLGCLGTIIAIAVAFGTGSVFVHGYSGASGPYLLLMDH